MAECTRCGSPATRRRRSPLAKVFARAAFECERCGETFHYYRSFVTALQRHACCPICATTDVVMRRSYDRIDRVSRNPLRRILIVFPIYHCLFCRYQFRDWRSVEPAQARVKTALLGG